MADNERYQKNWRCLSLKERFHKCYSKVGSSCWEWNGALHTTGYGTIQANKKVYLAHIISWELHFGERNGLCVLHKCDNRKCVNPSHLFLGTRKDNNLDRDLKGRGPRGEANWCTKLSASDIPLIRELSKAGTKQKDIALKFGVSQGAISNIVNKSTWKHI